LTFDFAFGLVGKLIIISFSFLSPYSPSRTNRRWRRVDGCSRSSPLGCSNNESFKPTERRSLRNVSFNFFGNSRTRRELLELRRLRRLWRTRRRRIRRGSYDSLDASAFSSNPSPDLVFVFFFDLHRLQKLAKDEEKARKDAATKAEADAAKAKHAAHELEVAKKREDDRLKREAERTARAAELAKKEEEKKKRQAEEREREAEQQRKKKERLVASSFLVSSYLDLAFLRRVIRQIEHFY